MNLVRNLALPKFNVSTMPYFAASIAAGGLLMDIILNPKSDRVFFETPIFMALATSSISYYLYLFGFLSVPLAIVLPPAIMAIVGVFSGMLYSKIGQENINLQRRVFAKLFYENYAAENAFFEDGMLDKMQRYEVINRLIYNNPILLVDCIEKDNQENIEAAKEELYKKLKEIIPGINNIEEIFKQFSMVVIKLIFFKHVLYHFTGIDKGEPNLSKDNLKKVEEALKIMKELKGIHKSEQSKKVGNHDNHNAIT